MNCKKALATVLSAIICFILPSYPEGFAAQTLVNMQQGPVPIELIIPDTKDVNGYTITHKSHRTANCSVIIQAGSYSICTAPDQKFYCSNKNSWINAIDIMPLDLLLCIDNHNVLVNNCTIIYNPIKLHTLSVAQSNIFYVTPHKIIAHNIEPLASAGAACLTFFYPPARVVLTAIEICSLGIAAIGTYYAYKKQKNIRLITNLEENKHPVLANGNGKDPNEDHNKKDHPFGIYEDAPYHHHNSTGKKGKCPQDGQTALDNSIPIDGNSKQRISLEGNNIVILKQTSIDKYHGYIITWQEIVSGGNFHTEAIRKTLLKANWATRSGKIIKTCM